MTPITASIEALARRLRQRFAGSELAETMAYEIVRLAAVKRAHDRKRKGDQPHLEAIEIAAEWGRRLAMESYQLDEQDLARYGRPLPRLMTFDPDGTDGEIYRALPPGAPYRLDGRVRYKRAA